MQLPLSASALVPVGVGAVLVGVLLILVALTARRRRPARGVAAPRAGSHAGRPPEPVGGSASPTAAPGPPDDGMAGATSATAPAAPGTGADPRNAAEAPELPVVLPPPAFARPAADSCQAGSSESVAAAVAQAFAVRAAASRPGMPMPTRRTNGTRRQQGSHDSRDEPQAAGARSNDDRRDVRDSGTAAPSPDGGPDRTDEPEPAAAGNDARDAAAPARIEEPAADAGGPESGMADRPSPESGTNGNGRGVVAPLGAAWTDGQPPAPDGTAATASDARDRLLAVLLDAPERAVGATEELVRCLRALERLTDAVRHERDVLRDVFGRLAADGLCSAQLARLAGMPLAEVEALLAPTQRQAR